MINILRLPLKAFNKIYKKIFVKPFVHRGGGRICDAEIANEFIIELLKSDSPCMICRFGQTEIDLTTNYLGIKNKKKIFSYITDRQREGWWDEDVCFRMQNNAGFFPNTKENLIKFAEKTCEDAALIDLLGSWRQEEKYMKDYLPINLTKVMLMYLEPWWGKHPWTKALEGKRVLVVHPFASQIKDQYDNHRTELFENPEVLPKFHLEVIPAVQSIGGEDNGFSDWFEALEWMENEIDRHDYDVCLIGCGAYGMPLAAHVKRQGKKAVHLGGALQLLFGIKGKRWEDPNYADIWGVPNGEYLNLVSRKGWVRPGNVGKPHNASKVEGACYW